MLKLLTINLTLPCLITGDAFSELDVLWGRNFKKILKHTYLGGLEQCAILFVKQF